MPAHVNYDELEKEYVTGTMSIRGLCRDRGIKSFSQVATVARERGWYQKRETFRNKRSEKTIEKIAENQAELASEIRYEMLTVVRAALYKFAEDLKRPDYVITASELVKVIQQGLLLIGEPTSRTEEKSLALNASFSDIEPDLLRELFTAARAARSESRATGPAIRQITSGPSPN